MRWPPTNQPVDRLTDRGGAVGSGPGSVRDGVGVYCMAMTIVCLLLRLQPLTELLVVLLAVWAPRARAQSAAATPTDTPSPTATASPTDTPVPDPAQVGEWSSIMNWPLVDVHMGLLPTGELVMWDAWETGGTQSA